MTIWKPYNRGPATLVFYGERLEKHTGSMEDWNNIHKNVLGLSNNKGQLVLIDDNNEIAAVGNVVETSIPHDAHEQICTPEESWERTQLAIMKEDI